MTKRAIKSSSAAVAIDIPSPADQDGLNNKSTVTLTWENLYYSLPKTSASGKIQLPEQFVLNNISGFVKPGEVVAIMGSSGAGKTMLLNVLAGRIAGGDIQGSILVNGNPRSSSSWRKTIAYVEQDDVLYQNLSVKETLYYAAKLRLPQSMSWDEKRKRVDQVVNDLSLRKCLNTRIGDSEKRGISGGERKRVTIGVELITQPKLLFLDEPTSGLDAFTAINIVESIRDLAVKKQCAVLMTIHQPREQILSLFSKVILLSQGKVLYFGDLPGAIKHFDRCGFQLPPQTNPSDFFLDTMTVDQRTEELNLRSVERLVRLENEWNSSGQPAVSNEIHNILSNTRSRTPSSLLMIPPAMNSFLHEFLVLLKRSFADELRDKGTIGATLGQSVVNVLLLGSIFWQIQLDSKGPQNIVGVLFFICIQLTFGYVMPTIATFTQQRQIIRRELASGSYRPASAYLAKIISQMPLVLLSTALFALPVYWMIGLYANVEQYFTFLAIVAVHAMASAMMGIMVSSGVPNVRIGQIIGPMLIVIFLIFGGQLVNPSSTPVFLRWIRWISMIYYSYSALAQNELNYVQFDCGGSPTCTADGQQVLEIFSLNEVPLWWCVSINAAMGLSYILIGFVLFRWRSKPTLKLK